MVELIISGKDVSGPAFASASKNAESLEKRLEKFGKVALVSGGAVAGGLAATVHQAAQLEAAVADALTLTQLSDTEYAKMSESMRKHAIDLSRELGISAEEIATSFYQVLSAGTQPLDEDFKNLTKTALTMSNLVGLEVPRSVEVLSDTLNAFQMRLSESSKVANVFFAASQLVATTVPQLADAFAVAGPAAGALGISLAETAAILDAFAAGGIKGAQAGTTFRIILTKLTAGTDEAREAIDDLGTKVFDSTGKMRPILTILREMQVGYRKLTEEQKASTLKVIAGEEAFSKLAAILEGNLDVVDQWREKIEEADGMQDAFNKKLETFQGQAALLKQELKAVVLTIGTELLPIAKDLISKFRENAQAIGEFVAAHKTAIPVVLGLSVALIGAGGLAQALLRIIQLVKILRTVSLTTFGVGGVIAAAVIALGGTIDHFLRKMDEAERRADEMRGKELGIAPDEAHDVRVLESLLARYKRMLDVFGEETKVTVSVKMLGLEDVQLKAAIDAITFRLRMMRGEFAKVNYEIDELSAKPPPVDEKKIDPAVQKAKEFNDYLETLASDITPRATDAMSGFGTKVDNMLRNMTAEQRAYNIEFLKYLEMTEEKRRQDKEDWNKPVEDPGKHIMSDEVIDMIQDNIYKVESALNSAFSSMMEGGKVLENFFASLFRSIAQTFIAEVSRMIAKWLVFEAIKSGLRFFGLPVQGGGTVMSGSTIGTEAGVAVTQYGGTIRAGTRGRDTVPILAGRGETILSHDLTERLDSALSPARSRVATPEIASLRESVDRLSSEMTRRGSGSIIIQTGILNATEDEAVRFGRRTRSHVDRFNYRFVEEGVD